MNSVSQSSIDAHAALDYLKTLSLQGLRPNTLLVCRKGWAGSFAQQAMSLAADPLWYCPLPGELALPARNEGTLILNDVARLRPDQQLQLFEWLSEFDQAQIISLTELPLFSIVSGGHFLESLYYRLNVIRLDVAHDIEAESRPDV